MQNAVNHIRQWGIPSAKKAIEFARKNHLSYVIEKYSNERIQVIYLKELVASFDLVEEMGGYSRCKFYMTGMLLNGSDSVRCPDTKKIVEKTVLEKALDDYQKISVDLGVLKNGIR